MVTGNIVSSLGGRRSATWTFSLHRGALSGSSLRADEPAAIATPGSGKTPAADVVKLQATTLYRHCSAQIATATRLRHGSKGQPPANDPIRQLQPYLSGTVRTSMDTTCSPGHSFSVPSSLLITANSASVEMDARFIDKQCKGGNEINLVVMNHTPEALSLTDGSLSASLHTTQNP